MKIKFERTVKIEHTLNFQRVTRSWVLENYSTQAYAKLLDHFKYEDFYVAQFVRSDSNKAIFDSPWTPLDENLGLSYSSLAVGSVESIPCIVQKPMYINGDFREKVFISKSDLDFVLGCNAIDLILKDILK